MAEPWSLEGFVWCSWMPVLDGNAEMVFRISPLLAFVICLFLKGSKGIHHCCQEAKGKWVRTLSLFHVVCWTLVILEVCWKWHLSREMTKTGRTEITIMPQKRDSPQHCHEFVLSILRKSWYVANNMGMLSIPHLLSGLKTLQLLAC